jgi:hypothetical protein
MRRLMNTALLTTIVLFIVSITSCATSGDQKSDEQTNELSPIRADDTSESTPPQLDEVLVGSLPVPFEDGAFILPSAVSPGDTITIGFQISDDSPGTVQFGTLSRRYQEGSTLVELGFSFDDNLSDPDLAVVLASDDSQVSEYTVRLAPEDSSPFLKVEETPASIEMGSTVQLTIHAGDLDGDTITLNVTQLFTRGDNAVSASLLPPYTSNFALEITTEQVQDFTYLASTPPCMPGHYSLKISAEDDDGQTAVEDHVLNVVPTVQGILDPPFPLIGTWFAFHPQPDEWASFEDAIGHDMVIVHVEFSSFCTKGCNEASHLDWVLGWIFDANKVPMISFDFFEWDWDAGKATETQPTLQKIVDGEYDNYLAEFARNLAAFNAPILWVNGWEFNITSPDDNWRGPRAFGPEANLLWSSVDDLYGYYGDPQKPDGPERYVDAYKHIFDIFQTNGANNVIFLWNPNWISAPKAPWNSVENYWPGEDYVHAIAPSVYNYQGQNRAFSSLYAEELLSFVQAHPGVPIIIRELGSDARGNSQFWHAEALAAIAEDYPFIKGVVFFSDDMEGQYAFHTDQEKTNAVLEALDIGHFGISP